MYACMYVFIYLLIHFNISTSFSILRPYTCAVHLLRVRTVFFCSNNQECNVTVRMWPPQSPVIASGYLTGKFFLRSLTSYPITTRFPSHLLLNFLTTGLSLLQAPTALIFKTFNDTGVYTFLLQVFAEGVCVFFLPCEIPGSF